MYSIVLMVGGLSLSTVSASILFRDNKRKKLALIPFSAGLIITLSGVFMRYR